MAKNSEKAVKKAAKKAAKNAPAPTEYKSKVALGQTYVDKNFGVSGRAIGLTFHRTGCERVLLRRLDKDGEKFIDTGFDAIDVVADDAEEIVYTSVIKLDEKYHDVDHGYDGVAATITFMENAEPVVELSRRIQSATGDRITFQMFDAYKLAHDETGVVAPQTNPSGPARPTASRY